MLTVKRLSLDDARLLIDGALARAVEIGVAMCAAVVDDGGHPIAFARMDGGKILSTRLAEDKAFTAAVSRRGTHEYNERSHPGNLVFGIHTAFQGRFCIVGGGLPVLDGEEVIGGIGLSGGAPEQDMDCAAAGLAHWQGARGDDADRR